MKYLISSGPGIGDLIQYLSLARSVKEYDKDCFVALIVSSNKKKIDTQRQFLELQDYIDDIYYYSPNELIHDAFLLLKLLLMRFDVGVLRIDNAMSYGKTWIEKIMSFIKCKRIIGNTNISLDGYIEIPQRVHYMQKNRLIAEKLGIAFCDNALNINKSKLPKVDNFVKKDIQLICLSIGTNPISWSENGVTKVYDVKSWSYEKWFDLCKKIIAEGKGVVLLGGAKELKEIEEANIQIPNSEYCYNFIGKTNIAESLALIDKCSVVVGSEGGMIHCASSLGKKVITIFGGSDYKQWNPVGPNNVVIALEFECYPCFGTRKGAMCKNHKCLEDITIDLIMEHISNSCI